MRHTLSLVLAAALLGGPVLIGCDRELNRTEKTTKNHDGSTSTSEQKTVEHGDGSVTTEKHTSHDNANP
jgi:hypothetical protein